MKAVFEIYDGPETEEKKVKFADSVKKEPSEQSEGNASEEDEDSEE